LGAIYRQTYKARLLAIIGTAVVLGITMPAAAQNRFHAKLVAVSEKERNDRLSVVVVAESCRVIRSFFQGFDPSGGAHWNVACSNGKAFVVLINNDARGSTRVMECEILKITGGRECFKKF
jgi:hypothetical protein